LQAVSYSIGFTSALIDNISSIGSGRQAGQFNSAGHKLGLGYTEGLCFLYQVRNMQFEFAIQYTQENDKFTNVPAVLSRQVVVDSSRTYIEKYLDYEHTENVSLRTSAISFLLKVNVISIETKKLSVSFGLGIAPSFITSETVYNRETHAFVKQMDRNNEGDSHLKTIGGINLIYSISNKLSLKVSPVVSYYLTSHRVNGYYVRPFNAGLELGLFYKLR